MPYNESMRWYREEAHRWTPNASQTGSKAPGRAGPLEEYPLFADHSQDAHLFDVDGNRYVDLIASLAAVGIGHGDKRVVEAVHRAISFGALQSLPTRIESMASERLCAITGWAEQVRWVKTGSEATEAAVRIARCATGRDNILTVGSGYHSWHSWFQAVKPVHPGVPGQYEGLICGLPYGERAEFTRQLKTKKYAAVILEPAPITGGGDVHWLTWLADESRKYGTLLVFDEIVWGFRLAMAGGTEYFGVQPDLATYGKAIGNGFAVGAVVGRRDLMYPHANVISGTFGGDGIGLAAAMAVMDIYMRDPIVATLWRRGELLRDRIVAAVNTLGMADAGIAFAVTGYAVHPVWKLVVPGVDDNIAMSYFLQQLAKRGVLYHPAGGNIMAVLTPENTTHIVEAVGFSLNNIAAIRRRGDSLPLVGPPYEAAFARAR